jgi:hypothetical protein
VRQVQLRQTQRGQAVPCQGFEALPQDLLLDRVLPQPARRALLASRLLGPASPGEEARQVVPGLPEHGVEGRRQPQRPLGLGQLPASQVEVPQLVVQFRGSRSAGQAVPDQGLDLRAVAGDLHELDQPEQRGHVRGIERPRPAEGVERAGEIAPGLSGLAQAAQRLGLVRAGPRLRRRDGQHRCEEQP